MTVFSVTLTINLRISQFLGISEIENLRWISLKPRVLYPDRGLRPPPQSKPLVSMKPPLVSISEPPKNRETADLLLKFH